METTQLIISGLTVIVAILSSILLAYRKDGVDKNELKNKIIQGDMQVQSSIDELHTAFKGRCTYSDLEREMINQSIEQIRKENEKSDREKEKKDQQFKKELGQISDSLKETTQEFTKTLKEVNDLLQENKLLYSEHIAYHKAMEQYSKKKIKPCQTET
jgi:uncharacterized protein (DUF3084 family)